MQMDSGLSQDSGGHPCEDPRRATQRPGRIGRGQAPWLSGEKLVGKHHGWGCGSGRDRRRGPAACQLLWSGLGTEAPAPHWEGVILVPVPMLSLKG